MKPWKSGGTSYVSTLHLSLQWGHGDEAVEEDGTHSITFTMNALQWGHGDEAVEEESVRIIDVGLVLASMGPRR